MDSPIVKAAKARIAELTAELAALREKKAAVEAKRKPIEDAEERLQRRLGKVAIVTNLASAYQVSSLRVLRAQGWGVSAWQGKKPKELREAIETGGIKLEPMGSVSYGARGIQQRTRIPQAADIAAWRKAVKARERAEAAAARARHAEAVAIAAVYERGTKVDLAFIVDPALALLQARLKVDAAERPGFIGNEIDRITQPWGSLPKAEEHLQHAAAGEMKEHCGQCQEWSRREAWNKRVAEAPRRLWTCPEHGRVKAAWLRGNFKYDGREAKDLPVFVCPRDGGIHADTDTVAKDNAIAEKARAKAEAEREKIIARRGGVYFLCPGCGDVPKSKVSIDTDVEEGEAPIRTVECDSCESVFDIDDPDDVQITLMAQAPAREPSDAEEAEAA